MALLDSGNIEEAERILNNLVERGYFPALIGISEIAKVRKDKNGILKCLSQAINNADWLSGVGIARDLIDLHQESYSLDPRKKTYEDMIAWKTQKSEYIHILYSCLRSLPPEMKSRWEDIFLDSASLVSTYSDPNAYKSDITVAEMQVMSSTWLMQGGDNFLRKLGAKNLYFFFANTPPDQIGAMYVINGLDRDLQVIDEWLQFYSKCETNRQEAGLALRSLANPENATDFLKAVDGMYEEDAAKGDLFGIYVGHATILNYLVHDLKDRNQPEVNKLKDKYWVTDKSEGFLGFL